MFMRGLLEQNVTKRRDSRNLCKLFVIDVAARTSEKKENNHVNCCWMFSEKPPHAPVVVVVDGLDHRADLLVAHVLSHRRHSLRALYRTNRETTRDIRKTVIEREARR